MSPHFSDDQSSDAFSIILFIIRARPASLWSAALRSRVRIADNMVDHKPVPDEQHDHCANGRADKTRALIELIVTWRAKARDIPMVAVTCTAN